MLSSFLISVAFAIAHRYGFVLGTHRELLLTVIGTTVCWLLVTYRGPQTDPKTLVEFYRKVRPFGPGWRRIRAEAGISEEEAARAAQSENIPLALVGWAAGCVAIWSSLFTVGNFLYGRIGYAVALLVTFLVSGAVLVRVVNRLWR
jgi:hypothetical protein